MKNFIGSGKKFNEFVTKVTVNMEKAEQFIYEYNGKKYLTFDVATKREPDQYGKTHDVSVWTKDEEQTTAPSVAPSVAPPSGFDENFPF